jgi:ribosome recycling factor
MTHNFSEFNERADGIAAWLSKEFSSVRTGQATPALLDGVQVESYGARVPINQIGNVGVEDPRTLRISVWDASQVQQVERAIIDADLGVSVAADDSGLRVIFPELTSERRQQLLKLAKNKFEEARVSLRGARDEVVKELDAAHKNGDMSEDERYTAKEKLQELVDVKNREFSDLLAKKESEIQQ